MLNRLDSSLGFQSQALLLRAERQRLIASNIANADTPGYQARDLDFATALRQATVGTGWQAWPDLAKASGLTLSSGEIELPAAEDMLPLACYLLAAGKTVAVEKAEPVYLRNEVAWKKLPGRE